ncbi:endonuclease/exonuclease/phosphatase family protein [Pelagicoccus albus]|uniref:Endonuclease/exonuclease/phosphatase family protein n=1 Tax=Pelagicoccus albus TaxID=415222 RepID=A0A7X1E9M8_9BACT|nr:endonuclease/exonuclease/phosphatase family protein [Pelagicoccus albus]
MTTWNLKWFPGGMNQTDKSAMQEHIGLVADTLRDLDPDILLVQEVKSQESLDMLAEEMGTGLKVIAVSRFPASYSEDPDGIDDQQVGILAKMPAVATATREFERDGLVDAPRGFVFAAFETEGELLGVYSVHLKSNRGEAAVNFRKRESSARAIVGHAEGVAIGSEDNWRVPDALIIGGDFNTEVPGDVEVRAAEKTMQQLALYGFENAYGDLPLEKRITIPASGRYPATTFDHILYRGIEKAGSVRIQEVEWERSDHYPVTVAFEL